ncbi:MAG: Fic family protein [Methanofollis liminatans]|uniref:Filamentation induced by cAMP protein Fic n=1 Tax=Methanofollis liminatans DSM 4140 TaxID=28892 RepID=J0SBR1_9EURY|nr:Fic family protein [Methanofollis liminatans]EJG08184.1 filamentation induced by cAMP protein Fic [Methanofollis liminatans DSM 4140]MDD3112456.1 Fic family protein [Methanofollis liminatans]
MMSERAGTLVPQKGGYAAFVPKPLPPEDLDLDEGLLLLLSKADTALARLDGVIQVLPNPDLFVAMYIKKEALLSSQIEGTQASLRGVLEFEADLKPEEDINEVREVVNYIKAMGHGMEKLEFSEFSIDLLNEIHRFLIQGTRGGYKRPGTIRAEQNWIGTAGTPIQDAVYVPPPPEMVPALMRNLERFIQQPDRIPLLIKAALIHAQFESVHPYLDGNGRMGRLLITFFLYYKGMLSKPLLYLSFYLKKHQQEYYRILNDIRYSGDWETWIAFFLRGVIETSTNSVETAKKIIGLRSDLVNTLLEKNIGGVVALKFIDVLFETPLITVSRAAEALDISRQSANALVKKFEDAGILVEITGNQRYKRYIFSDYLRIVQEGTYR